MKFYIRPAILIMALIITSFCVHAQDQKISKDFKEQTVQQLAEFINDFYVLPDVAKSTSDHLIAQWKEGAFDSLDQYESFADALTASVQSINKDKHMRVLLMPPYVAPANTPERKLEERLDQIATTRSHNAGLNEVKILEGNVGYLDIRSFAGMDQGKGVTDAYMKLLSNTDAIIIDLTKNTGGSPVMVQYLCSYFFDKHILLNTLYFRMGDELHEFWVLDEVGGSKLPDIPLFVMTSAKTFSGAEEFSYNMQTQKRATIVGQTTGGGANPGRSMNLNDQLRVIMPMGMAINPITETNWEGIGVEPDIKTAVEETFKNAHSLAMAAAQVYSENTNQSYTQLLTDLYRHFEKYNKENSDKLILKSLTACRDANLLREDEINLLGYDYLTAKNEIEMATCIFRANTLLFPESPNTFDSYAEALMLNGDLEASITNYQKAVALATSNGNGDVELYRKNMEAAISKSEAKE